MAWGTLAVLAPFPLLQDARANIGDYGFGSRTAALAGAGAAWGFGAFAAYSNPAGLPAAAGRKLDFSYGWLFMDPKFTPIQSVTIQNDFNSDATTTGNVNDDYRSVLGQTVGGAILVNPEWHQLSAGITLFTPFDPLGFTDTGEAYIPEYVLYRARGQRPQIELGLGARVNERFSLGLGLHVGYGITASGSVFLQTEDDTTSSMRVTASIKPQASPNLGWLLTSELPPEEPGSWSLGQTIRVENNAQTTMKFDSSARAFGSLAALDISFAAASSMFYDPWTIETGMSWHHSPVGRLLVQVDFQNWRRFKRPALNIQDPSQTCTAADPESCEPGGQPFIVNPSILPALSLRNTFTPRIAEEIQFGSSMLRLGYAFKPSIFSELPTSSGNYLDPSKHIATLGWGWKLPTFLGWNTPASIDVHASYQHLIAEHVTKTAGDETGDAGKTKIGAPGYDIGGRLWGGGATLTLEL